MLIENGADMNIRDTLYKKTPLMIAAEENALDVAGVLIQSGANLEEKDGSPDYSSKIALCFAVLGRA